MGGAGEGMSVKLVLLNGQAVYKAMTNPEKRIWSG
jgi:hypothetical protein